MKLYLTSAYGTHPVLDAVRRLASRNRLTRHTVCDSADEADAVLFVENTRFDDLRFARVSRHPLLERHRAKAFIYNESDRPVDVLPGLYCSMPRKRHVPERHVAVPYLLSPNPHVGGADGARHVERRWLYSFMGSMSHACRRPIMRLDDPEALLVDTSDFDVWCSSEPELGRRGRQFAEALAASRFVLCPRGIGTSSLRLYETLAAGRAPVIIADDWVPPPHVDWSFALQVEERRVRSIPGLLRALADEADERGRAARAAWEERFAPEVLFDTIGESIALLLAVGGTASGRRRSGLARLLRDGELLTRQTVHRWRGQAH